MTIPLPRLWLSLCLLSLTLSMSGCAQSDPCPDGQGRTADGFCAELLVPCLEGQVRLLNGECVDARGDDERVAAAQKSRDEHAAERGEAEPWIRK